MDSDKDKKVARLLNVAKIVLLDGNVDAAEQCLLRAKSLGCNEEINALLTDIEAEKQKSNNLERTQGETEKNDNKGGTGQEKIKVTTRKSDTENKNFNANQPEVIHTESENLLEYKSDKDNTKSEVNNENNAKDNDLQPKSVPRNDAFEQDDLIIHIAQDAMDGGDLNKAVNILLAAEQSYPSVRIKKLLQHLLDSVSNNAPKDTNYKEGSVDVDIGTRGVTVKQSNVNKGATLTGNYKTPPYAPMIEPAELDKDSKDNISPSVTVTVTKQTKDKQPTFIPEPGSDLSKNEPEKCTEAVTITKITPRSKSNVLSEARKVDDSNDMNFKKQNDADNSQFDQKEEPLHIMLWKVACMLSKMGKFDEAEYNLIESLRIHYDSGVNEMLKNVRELKSNMSKPKSPQPSKSENSQAKSCDTNCEAEKCYKAAWLAFTKKQFDEAEQLLLKAEQLRPQVRQKGLLSDVRQAKAVAENSRNKPWSSPRITLNHVSKTSNTPCKLHASETTNRNPLPSKEDVQSEHSIFTCRCCASRIYDYPEYGKNSEDSAAVLNRRPSFDGTEVPRTQNATTHRADVYTDEKEVDNHLKRAQDAQDFDTAKELVLDAQNLRPNDAAAFSEKIQAVKTENEVEAKIDSIPRQTEIYTAFNNDDMKRINAQQCLNKARTTMLSGDLEKAKRWLLRAERFYPTEVARGLLEQVHEALFKETLAPNENDVNAKPGVDPDGNNYKITGNKNEKNFETIEDSNRISAENCMDKALAAISSDNLEDAKRLLLKAERFYPTERARDLLDQVQQGLFKEALATNKNDVNAKPEVNSNGNSYKRTGNKDENNFGTIDDLNRFSAELYIDTALGAISSDYLEDAKRLLLKAERFYPTERARDLLHQVQQALFKEALASNKNDVNAKPEVNPNGNSYKRTGNKDKNNFETIDDLNKISAEQCMDKALAAMSSGDFEKAERLLLRAERLCSLVDVKQLLKEVRAKINAGSSSNGRSCGYRKSSQRDTVGGVADECQSSMDDDTVEDAADECLDKAQVALDRGELDKAERWVARAQRMRASVRGEELKQRVEEAKHLRSQPTPEQLEAIHRVLAASSPYEIFGVGPVATNAEIEKAYRRLAQLLQPDKNPSPDAEEAYKTVTAAFNQLMTRGALTSVFFSFIPSVLTEQFNYY